MDMDMDMGTDMCTDIYMYKDMDMELYPKWSMSTEVWIRGGAPIFIVSIVALHQDFDQYKAILRYKLIF